MFEATDTGWAPWHAAHSNDNKKALLAILRHILDSVPYQKMEPEKIVLPHRQKRGDYVDSKYSVKFINDAN